VARYEINESVTEPRAVFGTDLSTVQAAVPKNGAPVVARNAGTSTSRALYAAASGGSPLTQPILTTNGRIDAYVEGEAPVDLLINYGLSNQYTQRFTPPQVGAAGPPGGTGIALNMDDFPVIAPEVNEQGQFQRALDGAATAGRALFFLGTKTIQGVTIPSNTRLFGADRWSVVKVASSSPGLYPLYMAPGVHDVRLHNFEIDGNKANITGDPDVDGSPSCAVMVQGTIATPCQRIYVEDVYQHDSKRLGIVFQNVQKGRIKAVIENNERDGATVYMNCRDIVVDLIVSGCGDDYLGINSSDGTTTGLCERITGRLVASGPSSRNKGRALTVRGGHTIKLDVIANDLPQSSVVLNNFGSANLTDFDINVLSYRAGLGGSADKHGVLIQVGDGGYIGQGRVSGRVTSAQAYGVVLDNAKGTPGTNDIRDLDLNVVSTGAVTADYLLSAPGLSDVRVRPKVMTASATWDPPSLGDGASAQATIAVPGAVVGDVVAGVAHNGLSGIFWDFVGRVTAADTVTVNLTNRTGSTVNLGAGTLRVEVHRHLL
jgi:hypothetical protein